MWISVDHGLTCKISSKILEQKFNPLPDDVSLLQQPYRMHGESIGKKELADTAMHMIMANLLWFNSTPTYIHGDF